MKAGKKKNKGIIISALGRLCDKISTILKKSAAFSFVAGYEKSENAFRNSSTCQMLSSVTSDNKGFFRRFKRAASSQFENSLLIKTISSLSLKLQCMPLKIYGMFFASFGVYTVIMYLLKTYAFLMEGVQIEDLLLGIVVVLTSVPMLFCSKCLVEVMGESAMFKSILTRLFGIPAVTFEKRTVEIKYHSISVIIGLVLGVLTFFVHPAYILICLATLVLLGLLMSYPEAGVILAIAFVPFLGMVKHPSITLALLVVMTAFSYLVKLLRGKRVIKFEILVLFVLFFWGVVLLSGITPGGVGGMNEAVLSAGLILVYFLAANLVRSRNWLNVTLALCIASATLTSFIGLSEHLFGLSQLDWIDSSVFSGIAGRVTSVFDNPNVLAAYLIIVFPVTVAVCFYHKDRSVKLLCGLCASIMLLCIVFTWSRGAWLGLAVSIVVLLLCMSLRYMMLLPPVAVLVAAAAWIFPDSFGARATNIFTLADSTNHYRVSIWEGTGKMLRETWICGIGAGEQNFRSAYLNFALMGIENAPHSHSLYLQLLLQVGVLGLVFLGAVVLMAMQKILTHNFNVRADAETRLIALGLFAGVVAMLVFGIFDYTWYNFRILFMFWAILGLASAAVNIGREDIKFNEIFESNNMDSESESAELTIEIREGQDIK
jgi:O-antigen ligase